MVATTFQNWLACVGAFFLLTLSPLASANNWQSIIMIATIWWIFALIIRPILHFILLPFNIISLGAIGALVQFLAIWLLFWLIPGFKLHQVIVAGFAIQGWFLIMVVAFVVALFQRLLVEVFRQLFH